MASSPTKRHQSNSDKGQNIQVFVRCRPLNESEKAQRSYSVVDTPNSREITIKEKQASSLTKTFQFDRVFGIKSKQLDVYRSVVEPLIGQVMQGYNCTVFAYGQTGTGKTFTMEGGDGRDDPNMTWENDPTAGIIPRALAQLFDELRLQQEAEFSVRVSFLELYNEEIFDLLSGETDLNKLRLFEDSTRKGSVIIQNLEEVQVHSKREVYDILEKGSKKRQTAATLMNAHSSRSHTVFTVTVHMKESSLEGEEVLRIGKLNLVDLAGSENVGRSGAVDKRAREAGNINQSLLTLGRVITCLVERTPHVPYRESKLTRLLQDSLGGRTKTSIIATVSPAGINLEETLSTLDYAHRAKNIMNKPEVNQKQSKKAVLKEYTEEIERLRKDLLASREKNGVFLDNKNYQDLMSRRDASEQEINEKIGQLKALTEEMAKKEEMFDEVSAELAEKNAQLESTTTRLTETENTLSCTRTVLHQTAVEKEEQSHLVEKHQETETKLKVQAKKLLEVADVTTKEGGLLHDKLDRLKNIEDGNKEAKDDFNQVFSANIEEVVTGMATYGAAHGASCSSLRARLDSQLGARAESLAALAAGLGSLTQEQVAAVDRLDVLRGDMAESERGLLAGERLGLAEVSEEGRRAAEVFQQERVRPVLAEVAGLVQLQVEELALLREAVCGDVDKLANTVEVFSTETMASVAELKTAVMEYAKENNIRMKKLQTKNDEISASEASIKALLEALTAGYAAHSALVRGNTAAIQQGAEQDLAGVQSLVTTSGQVAEQAEQRSDRTRADIDAENVRINEYVEEAASKCQQTSQQLVERKEELESRASDHVAQTKAGWTAYQEAARARAEAHATSTKVTREAFEKVAGASKVALEAMGTKLKKNIETAKDTDEAAVLRLATEVEAVGERCEATMTELQGRLTIEKETVVSFVTEVLQEDQPTGATPARAARSFPRYLEATSPHERILQRYRGQAEAAVVAARLPLDDSDNDDSLVSASNPSLSRESSDGEIRPGRRAVSRQNSAEHRASRSSSRQNSATELRGRGASVASVTSELGSELGDQENQDPNFRKPAAAATGLPGKRGATGLPKPRGRLASKNS